MKCTRNGERVKMCIRATNERRRIQIDVLRIEIVHNCFCIAFITKSVNYFHRPYCTYFICYTVLKNSFKFGVCVYFSFFLSFWSVISVLLQLGYVSKNIYYIPTVHIGCSLKIRYFWTIVCIYVHIERE